MPKEPRTTDNPLGKKILTVLREQGHADDLNYLAKAFDVNVQSTYDWIKFGRMSKDRFARLVEWSGRSLHWWFDVPARVEDRPAWPFPNVDEEALCGLDRDTLIALGGGLHLQAAQMGVNLRNGLTG